MDQFVDYYGLLEIEPEASEDDIELAVRNQRKMWTRRQNSPDVGVQTEAKRRMKLLSDAKAVLLNPHMRRMHDIQRRSRRGQPESQHNIQPRQDNHLPPQSAQASVGAEMSAVQLLLEFDDVSEAVKRARAATADYPNVAELWFVRGIAHEAASDKLEADKCYAAAIKLEARPAFWRRKALNLLPQGDCYDTAFEALQQERLLHYPNLDPDLEFLAIIAQHIEFRRRLERGIVDSNLLERVLLETDNFVDRFPSNPLSRVTRAVTLPERRWLYSHVPVMVRKPETTSEFVLRETHNQYQANLHAQLQGHGEGQELRPPPKLAPRPKTPHWCITSPSQLAELRSDIASLTENNAPINYEDLPTTLTSETRLSYVTAVLDPESFVPELFDAYRYCNSSFWDRLKNRGLVRGVLICMFATWVSGLIVMGSVNVHPVLLVLLVMFWLFLWRILDLGELLFSPVRKWAPPPMPPDRLQGWGLIR